MLSLTLLLVASRSSKDDYVAKTFVGSACLRGMLVELGTIMPPLSGYTSRIRCGEAGTQSSERGILAQPPQSRDYGADVWDS